MADNANVCASQCHCGAVRFEVTFKSIRRCTCSYCRMPGAVVAMAETGGIKILQDEDALKTYRFRAGMAQHFFCSAAEFTPIISVDPTRTFMPSTWLASMGSVRPISPKCR